MTAHPTTQPGSRSEPQASEPTEQGITYGAIDGRVAAYIDGRLHGTWHADFARKLLPYLEEHAHPDEAASLRAALAELEGK